MVYLLQFCFVVWFITSPMASINKFKCFGGFKFSIGTTVIDYTPSGEVVFTRFILLYLCI